MSQDTILKNDFYVYEWFNIDTSEVFYVGKGKGNRYKDKISRNQYFKNYCNKYNCDVRKVEKGLEEDEAFRIEIELIKKYRQLGQCKCNLSDGGEGCTFPQGSWNDLFRKLQYLHDIKGAMDDMSNEDDYNPENLKTKSLDELIELYEEYYEYKDGVLGFKSLDVFDENGDLNDGWECFSDHFVLLNRECMIEMKYQNHDILMLTELLATNIAKSNKIFRSFLKYKTEMDFICHNINTEEFISLIFDDIDYRIELIRFIFKSVELLKVIGKTLRFNSFIKVKSYRGTEDDFIIIRFNTVEDQKIKYVKIHVYDLIWGILMYKDKPLFQIIYDEIFSAPLLDYKEDIFIDQATTSKVHI